MLSSQQNGQHKLLQISNRKKKKKKEHIYRNATKVKRGSG
jgi:hypothetical protein